MFLALRLHMFIIRYPLHGAQSFSKIQPAHSRLILACFPRSAHSLGGCTMIWCKTLPKAEQMARQNYFSCNFRYLTRSVVLLGSQLLQEGGTGVEAVAGVAMGPAAGVEVDTHLVGVLMGEAEGVEEATEPLLLTLTRPSQHKQPMIPTQLEGMMAAEGQGQEWGALPSPKKHGRVTGPALAATPTMPGGELAEQVMTCMDGFAACLSHASKDGLNVRQIFSTRTDANALGACAFFPA